MSIELMDEHERGERVRRGLHDNGSALRGGGGLGLLAFFGWQWHQGGQLQAKHDAAMQYEAVRKAVESDQTETVAEIAKGLNDKFPGSPYVALAQLQMAQLKSDAGDFDAALAALEAARAATDEVLLKDLTALRMARIKHAQGALDEALALLSGLDKSYSGLAGELRGDILRAQGKPIEAVEAYQDALTHLQEGLPARGLVELKLADLGASAPLES
jgi:predicted negative regulator of RcsB-dependent stress response